MGDVSASIAIDSDQARSRAAAYRAYADQVEAQGSVGVMTREQLQAALGPLFEPYIESKLAEMEARKSAYARLAKRYRDGADKLENTARLLDGGDVDAAAEIQRAVAGTGPGL